MKDLSGSKLKNEPIYQAPTSFGGARRKDQVRTEGSSVFFFSTDDSVKNSGERYIPMAPGATTRANSKVDVMPNKMQSPKSSMFASRANSKADDMENAGERYVPMGQAATTRANSKVDVMPNRMQSPKSSMLSSGANSKADDMPNYPPPMHNLDCRLDDKKPFRYPNGGLLNMYDLPDDTDFEHEYENSLDNSSLSKIHQAYYDLKDIIYGPPSDVSPAVPSAPGAIPATKLGAIIQRD